MDFFTVVSQIIKLFITIFVGYILNRIKIIDNETNKKLSSIVINVTAPALVMAAMANGNNLGTMSQIISIVGISLLCYTFLITMSFLIPKILKVADEELGVYQFMVIFSNVAFMGFPVLEAIYGKGTTNGMKAILYASILNLPYNFLLYTLGVYFISKHGGQKVKIQPKNFLNAGVVAVIIGLFFFITKIKMPSFLYDTVQSIGSITTPLSMMIIGASLANIPIKEVLSNYKLYIFSMIKLIVIPICVWLIFKNIITDSIILGVCVIISGMPIAAMTVILSKEYGGNEKVASEGIFISTMLSLISIPLLVMILNR